MAFVMLFISGVIYLESSTLSITNFFSKNDTSRRSPYINSYYADLLLQETLESNKNYTAFDVALLTEKQATYVHTYLYNYDCDHKFHERYQNLSRNDMNTKIMDPLLNFVQYTSFENVQCLHGHGNLKKASTQKNEFEVCNVNKKKINCLKLLVTLILQMESIVVCC